LKEEQILLHLAAFSTICLDLEEAAIEGSSTLITA